MSAHARLDRYRTTQALTHSALAGRLGCTVSMVSMLCQGDRSPGLALAVRIERETASWPLGPIRPWEWVEADEKGKRAA